MANNLKNVAVTFKKAYYAARTEIIENNCWSPRTFSRKMNNLEKITTDELKVVATAFENNLQKPMQKIFEAVYN